MIGTLITDKMFTFMIIMKPQNFVLNKDQVQALKQLKDRQIKVFHIKEEMCPPFS